MMAKILRLFVTLVDNILSYLEATHKGIPSPVLHGGGVIDAAASHICIALHYLADMVLRTTLVLMQQYAAGQRGRIPDEEDRCMDLTTLFELLTQVTSTGWDW